MKPIDWSPLALDDVLGVWEYIKKDSPANARRYADRLRNRAELLSVFPESGRSSPEFGEANVRSLVESSHVIFYAVTDDRIEILRVIHGACDMTRLRLR